ncbi:NADP(H)-dependent aldo-keto reductase [Methylonatrum kenyense]|uniref:NADP(H)-dependent aldo-keto reductase n=1 Tax=Methylonatrum kenyense TaxID=455253 RepID=UPI0020BF15BD|nr:NADP(H)-dependent aldo-keto reductase [Methylonatrum kenyense]MCK8516705.1 NADP(H)-dependent aldo-keto reductase [Methylonatrum kenyense]
MEYRPLGTSGIDVSALCLGTMTWGEQNTEAEAHEQLDYAVSRGINFIDAAEMYPVPPKAETQGLTEQYIGSWLKGRQDRDKLVIATKIAGPGLDTVRDGESRFTASQLREAVDGSLRRLQTDYIDLYQLHWPARNANYFGKLGYQPARNDLLTPIEETLETLDALVREGKILNIGLSNETAWGVMRFLHLAETRGWPRVQSVQNPYNLLNRSYEVGLAEVSHRERCGLLAYSPLGFGVLSGKYLDGRQPAGARLTLFTRFQRYLNDAGQQATAAYVKLARDAGLDPAQMALAFVTSRPFLSSNIIGATTMEQLKSNIDSAELELTGDVLEGIDAIHAERSNPCP